MGRAVRSANTAPARGEKEREGRRDTHTHTAGHLVTPVQKELVHVVLHIVPATGGRGEGGGKGGRRGGQTDKDREMEE